MTVIVWPMAIWKHGNVSLGQSRWKDIWGFIAVVVVFVGVNRRQVRRVRVRIVEELVFDDRLCERGVHQVLHLAYEGCFRSMMKVRLHQDVALVDGSQPALVRGLVLHRWDFRRVSIEVWVVLLAKEHLRKSVIGHTCVWLPLVVKAWGLFSDDESAGVLWVEPVMALHLGHFRGGWSNARAMHIIIIKIGLTIVTARTHRLRQNPLLLHGFKSS